MARAQTYTWTGKTDPGTGQPVEYFGGGHPIPPRDLTAEDTAAFGPEEWALIESANGRRLYQPNDGKPAETSRARTKE